MESKYVYAYNQNEAMSAFRSWMKETGSSKKRYIPKKARCAGTKHNMKVYQVWYIVKDKK